MAGYLHIIKQLVLGAYLLPVSTYTPNTYTYKNYVSEALRVTKVFFINSDTKMNPNMNYATVNPSSYDFPKSLSDVFLVEDQANNGGFITWTKSIEQVLDSLMLLEQSTLVFTDMDQAMKDDIASTMVGVRKWFTAFANWMTNTGKGLRGFYSGNNIGTWHAAAYSSIALFTKNTTLISSAKKVIESFGNDSSSSGA